MSDGAAWQAVVDERLIARCQAHVARGERLRRDWSVPLHARPPRTHLDPAEWRTGFLRVERERDIPLQLTQDLHELMPQALLRDLHRPVRDAGWVARELVAGTGDRGGFMALTEARATRTARPELPRVEPATRTLRAYQTWRRALYAERWQPLRPDGER